MLQDILMKDINKAHQRSNYRGAAWRYTLTEVAPFLLRSRCTWSTTRSRRNKYRTIAVSVLDTAKDSKEMMSDTLDGKPDATRS
jgi:hypothetical protein